MPAADPRPLAIVNGLGQLVGQLVNDPTGGVSLELFAYSGDTRSRQSQLLVGSQGVSLNGVLVDTSQPVDGQVLTYDAAATRIKMKPAATFMLWVPYTGPPQSFLKQDLTRDGDWTMVANKNTSDRPAPQASGTEEDLLPAWTPTQLSARATYTVANEFTISSSGWIDQYGVGVQAQNVGALHAITLQVNGVTRDSLSVTPASAGVL